MPRSAVAVDVRAMATADIRWAADLHRAALPHGLFPSLGPRFLRQYLATYVDSPAAVALVAERNGALAGFLVGTLDHGHHRAHVMGTHLRPIAVRGALALLVRPTVAWRFVRTRLVRYVAAIRRPRVHGPREQGRDRAVAVLAHVAVTPASRGTGVGAELVRAFLDAARAAGASRCELVTRADDDGAFGFYRRLGWDHIGESRDRDGGLWTRLGLDLGSQPSEPSPSS